MDSIPGCMMAVSPLDSRGILAEPMEGRVELELDLGCRVGRTWKWTNNGGMRELRRGTLETATLHRQLERGLDEVKTGKETGADRKNEIGE